MKNTFIILTCAIFISTFMKQSGAQSLVSMSPNSSSQNQYLTTTITGSGNVFTPGSPYGGSDVRLEGTTTTIWSEPGTASYIDPDHISVSWNIPLNAAPGAYSLAIDIFDIWSGITTLSLPNAFEVGCTGFSLSQNHTDASCPNSNGSIDLTVTPAGSYTYHWSNNATTQDISNLSTGNYTVTVTGGGCSENIQVYVANTGLPSVSATKQNPYCGGTNGSINLIPGGSVPPYTFHWNNNATTQNLSGLNPGNYSATVTSATGCTASITVSLININSPSLSSSFSNSTCNQSNGSINLTVSAMPGPFTYHWNTGATTEDLSGLSLGTYSVTVTKATGCSASTNCFVSNSGTHAVLSQTHTNSGCNQSTGSINLSLSGGNAPFTYLWSNGATTQDLSGLAAGNYSVTVTGNFGCTSSISVNITSPSPQLTETHTNSICPNNSTGMINLSVSGGTAPYFYLWSTGATTQDLSSIPNAAYTVTVTDAGNCTSTLAVTLISDCQAPDNASASAITSNKATVSWFGNSCAVKYRIQYRVQGSTTWTTTTVNAPSVSKTLSGLLSLTTYEYRIRTDCNSSGTTHSVYTSIQTFTSLCNCALPTGISVSNISQSSVKINWTGNSCAYQYRLQYRKTGTTTWTSKLIPAPTLFKTLTGLTANTSYEYRLRTECSSGTVNSGWTATATFTTLLRLEDETELENNFISITPNPCSICEVTGIYSTDELIITDIIGRKVNADFSKSSNGFYISLPVSANGIFLIRNIRTGEVVKFVKQ